MVTDDNVAHEAQRSGKFRGHERDPKEKVAESARSAIRRALAADLKPLEHHVLLSVLHVTSTWGRTWDTKYTAHLAALVYDVAEPHDEQTRRVRKALKSLRGKGIIDYVPGRGHPGNGIPSRVSIVASQNEGVWNEGVQDDRMRGRGRENEGVQDDRMRGREQTPLPELPERPKKPKSGAPKRNRADERKTAELLRRDETRARGLEAVASFFKSEGVKDRAITWTLDAVRAELDKGVSVAYPFGYALKIAERENEDAAREERIEARSAERRSALDAQWERARNRGGLCPHDQLPERCPACKLKAMEPRERHPANNLGPVLDEISTDA